jgi:hypothetical protein
LGVPLREGSDKCGEPRTAAQQIRPAHSGKGEPGTQLILRNPLIQASVTPGTLEADDVAYRRGDFF